MLSRAYQLDSRFDARNNELDPDNVLVWRMSKHRLEGEAVRDAMLAISGQLDRTRPKGSVVARSGDGYANIATAGELSPRPRATSVRSTSG